MNTACAFGLNRKTILTILFLLVGIQSSLSQTRITGHVLDKEGQPAEGFVTLNLPGQSAILSFADLD